MLSGYRAAGGTATITEVNDLGDSISGYLNYVHAQVELSLNDTQPAILRTEASQRIPDLLNPPPIHHLRGGRTGSSPSLNCSAGRYAVL